MEIIKRLIVDLSSDRMIQMRISNTDERGWIKMNG